MKTFKIICRSLLGLLGVFLLLVMYMPITFVHNHNKEDYSSVIKDANLSDVTRLTNVHMLGAHDAYSHNISLLSKTDPAEDGIPNNFFAKLLFKGGMTRVARAQKHGAKALLESGVRYFDVRVSYYKDDWYTKHGFISDKLSVYLSETYTFLQENNEEFIIFDVQHIFTGEKNINDFINYLLTTKLNNLTFADFVFYANTKPTLNSLTYGEVKGGIVFLLNEDSSVANANKQYFYERGNGESNSVSIRSKWHNQNNLETMIPLIDEEAAYLAAHDHSAMFRLNQAQLTPDYLKAPFKTIFDWSLLDIAKHSNAALLAHENFDTWLSAMPIFMVDFANSDYENFTANINAKLIMANKALAA